MPTEIDLTPVKHQQAPAPTPKSKRRTRPLHVYARTSRLLLLEDQEFFRPFGPGTIDIEVTSGVGQRALELGSTLFRLAEKKGHEVIPGEIKLPIGYARLSVSNEVFDVKIRELTSDIVITRAHKRLAEQQDAAYKRGDRWLLPHERPAWSEWETRQDDGKRPFDQRDREYNGRLSLEIPRVGRWADTDKVAVEDHVASALLAMERHAAESRVANRRAEANQSAWERETEIQNGSRAGLQRQRDPRFRKRRCREFALEQARDLQNWRSLRDLLDEIGAWENPSGSGELDKFIRHLREMVDSGRLTAERMTANISVKKLSFDE